MVMLSLPDSSNTPATSALPIDGRRHMFCMRRGQQQQTCTGAGDVDLAGEKSHAPPHT